MVEAGSAAVAAGPDGYSFPWEKGRIPATLVLRGDEERRILATVIAFREDNLSWYVDGAAEGGKLLKCGLWGSGVLRGLGVMEDIYPGGENVAEEIRQWWATRRRLEVKFEKPPDQGESSVPVVKWVRFEQGGWWVEIKRGTWPETSPLFQVRASDGKSNPQFWWFNSDLDEVNEMESGAVGVGERIPLEVLRIGVGSVEETIKDMWGVWRGMGELLTKIKESGL